MFLFKINTKTTSNRVKKFCNPPHICPENIHIWLWGQRKRQVNLKHWDRIGFSCWVSFIWTFAKLFFYENLFLLRLSKNCKSTKQIKFISSSKKSHTVIPRFKYPEITGLLSFFIRFDFFENISEYAVIAG